MSVHENTTDPLASLSQVKIINMLCDLLCCRQEVYTEDRSEVIVLKPTWVRFFWAVWSSPDFQSFLPSGFFMQDKVVWLM